MSDVEHFTSGKQVFRYAKDDRLIVLDKYNPWVVFLLVLSLTACDCNPEGSESLQCGEDGQCPCKDGVHGMKCDQCEENYYDLAQGCIRESLLYTRF